MPDKTWYMACLDLEGADVLVVGGGTVGLEKARGVLDEYEALWRARIDRMTDLIAVSKETFE